MKKNKSVLLSTPYLIWMVVFTLIPLGVVCYYALTAPSTGEFSLVNLRGLNLYWGVLWQSIFYAVASAFICLLLGYPINDMTYIKPIYHVIQDIGAYGPKYYTRNLSDEITPDYPATYHWHGVNDTLLKELVYWRQGPQLEAALQANHVKHVYRVFNNAPHVCGIGTGTDAENWLVEATAFWEEQCA